MIDIHNHILGGLDDGSPDLETTFEYLKLVNESGVKKLIFTPHYMPGFYDNSSEKIKLVYDEVMKHKAEFAPDVEFFHAAEVYLNGETILDDIYRENLFINNGQYVLVENNLNGFTEDLYTLLYNMIRKGLKPILAHPERYQDIRRDITKAEDLIHRDVYMQINTSSLLGGYGKQVQDIAFELIDRGWAHFLGSDCHCHSGVYDYAEAVNIIRNEFDDHIAKLLSETYPEKMLNNQSIPYFYMVRKELPRKKSFWQKLFSLGD
jgi:protein-tyrosine phosphatase